jgi:hypothetical protein
MASLRHNILFGLIWAKFGPDDQNRGGGGVAVESPELQDCSNGHATHTELDRSTATTGGSKPQIIRFIAIMRTVHAHGPDLTY